MQFQVYIWLEINSARDVRLIFDRMVDEQAPTCPQDCLGVAGSWIRRVLRERDVDPSPWFGSLSSWCLRTTGADMTIISITWRTTVTGEFPKMLNCPFKLMNFQAVTEQLLISAVVVVCSWSKNPLKSSSEQENWNMERHRGGFTDTS